MASFDAVVARVRAEFPRLRMEVREGHPEVEAAARLPAQEGLSFTLDVNLQNRDELHLTAGHFWAEWFPCGDQRVLDDFVDAVIGLVSGSHRIVESYVFDRAVSARLERPKTSGGWQRVATWSNLGSLIPWARRQKILQNRP